MQHFSPNQITVTVKGSNVVEVEARHEEKQDEHGLISRHFVRKYMIPPDYDINWVQSNLSSDGVLTISAPKKNVGEEQVRNVPIQETGRPEKIVGNNQADTQSSAGDNQADTHDSEE